MNVRFLSDARTELDDVALYYEYARPGLGDDFYAEVDAALALVRDFPQACPPSAHGARRRNIDRFPYFLIYVIENNEIVVAAVSHVSRDPAYWHKRLL
ncbi:MAG: type II toxin-antitoxin system RelE/ParE family toxin [Rhodomicrobium sp.]|nr:type II toxin-antitoxin system RelE/ParE family toxin [Rhodomicrobium sp.]